MAALQGQRVLLTGASSGIGWELARELGRKGADLALAARRVDRLERLAEGIEAGGARRPVVLEADLSRRHAGAALAERALGWLGGIDVLVNNAGGGVGGLQWRAGDGCEAREAFELNLWSPLALTAALVPQMRERGAGSVVNVTSVSQVFAMWGMGHYAATKAALALATETLRLELTGSGVHVLEVIPGPTNTAIQAETRLIPGAERALQRAPMGTPEELARRIVRALERRRRRLVYPRRLALVYLCPSLGRRYMEVLARRLGGELDPEDPRVVRSGSMGDPISREARADWERVHG